MWICVFAASVSLPLCDVACSKTNCAQVRPAVCCARCEGAKERHANKRRKTRAQTQTRVAMRFAHKNHKQNKMRVSELAPRVGRSRAHTVKERCAATAL
jgi:hypothetical protein